MMCGFPPRPKEPKPKKPGTRSTRSAKRTARSFRCPSEILEAHWGCLVFSAAVCRQQQDERSWMMQLSQGGADWLEVKRTDAGARATWRIDGRLRGSHYELGEPFATKHAAQGSALLLAMRLLHASRSALQGELELVPGAWWWKILPIDDPSAEHRSICSTRVLDSAEAAERSGRAAGAGWWLYVYGPGCVRAFGRLAR